MMKRIQLVSKRQRWGLTWYGRLLILLLLAISLQLFTKNIVGFLSSEAPVDAKIMVIEGYVPDFAFPKIIQVFEDEEYDLIVTSGTIYDQGFYLSNIHSSAELIEQSLIALGFDASKVVAIPVDPPVLKDRTYHSAKFSYNYIKAHYPETQSVNLVSLGAHSRRSRLLFKMVYEPDIQLGNIVVHYPTVTKDNWYKSSRGFRTVLNECLAYGYVLLFFSPEGT
jgi:hypothetical protein